MAAHWRDSGLPARFFGVDARAAFPIFLFLMHIRLWTFLTAIVCIIFFGFLERKGFKVPVFMLWLRSFLAGPRKLSRPWWRRE